ncbi:UNVERIFIED_CONTAM: hypothetical protein FKN15_072633 [Acipenser sinensis]
MLHQRLRLLTGVPATGIGTPTTATSVASHGATTVWDTQLPSSTPPPPGRKRKRVEDTELSALTELQNQMSEVLEFIASWKWSRPLFPHQWGIREFFYRERITGRDGQVFLGTNLINLPRGHWKGCPVPQTPVASSSRAARTSVVSPCSVTACDGHTANPATPRVFERAMDIGAIGAVSDIAGPNGSGYCRPSPCYPSHAPSPDLAEFFQSAPREGQIPSAKGVLQVSVCPPLVGLPSPSSGRTMDIGAIGAVSDIAGPNGSGYCRPSPCYPSHAPSPDLAEFFQSAPREGQIPSAKGVLQVSVCPPLVCNELYHGENICGHLENYTKENQAIQSKTSYILLVYVAVLSLVSIPPAIIFGSWSDKAGRKLGMILPSVCSAVGGGFLIAVAEVEQINAYWTIFTAFVIGISGGHVAVFLSVFSYLADVTNDENRTLRMAILESMVFIGGTVGFLLSGTLIQYFSFTPVFGTFCLCHVLSVLYVLLLLRNPDSGLGKILNGVASHGSDDEPKLSIFMYAKLSFKSVLKKRAGKDRLKLQLLILCTFLMNICSAGESPFNYVMSF